MRDKRAYKLKFQAEEKIVVGAAGAGRLVEPTGQILLRMLGVKCPVAVVRLRHDIRALVLSWIRHHLTPRRLVDDLAPPSRRC